MDWRKIDVFLSRFKNIRKPEDFIRGVIREEIKKTLRFDIEEKNMRLLGGTLYLKGLTSGEKSEIFIKSEAVLKELSLKLGRMAPKEIRF